LLVGIDEDLSFYEGAGEGPDVTKVKEAITKEAMMSCEIEHQVGVARPAPPAIAIPFRSRG